MSDARSCPVCATLNTQLLLKTPDKSYFKCDHCAARFLDRPHHLSKTEERAHYECHQNEINDPGYRKFLSKLFIPFTKKLSLGAHGLDYGAGPGPALAAMFVEAGFSMDLYDPFFHKNSDVLKARYDFIVCTETAEHFSNPADEFARLFSLLRPGGWLGVMTSFQIDDDQFETWHYRKDPTHVVFYREQTLRYIAASLGMTCEIPQNDIAMMNKPISP